MASRQQLVKLILKQLGVWQAGQDLPPEDYQAVNEELEQRLLAMARLDVYGVVDPDNVPDEAVTSMASYLSGEYLQTFGIVGEEAARISTDAAEGERRLRYMRVMPATGAPTRAEYF